MFPSAFGNLLLSRADAGPAADDSTLQCELGDIRRVVVSLFARPNTAWHVGSKWHWRLHVACLKYQPRHGRSRGWDRHRLNAIAKASLHRGHGPAREQVEEPPHGSMDGDMCKQNTLLFLPSGSCLRCANTQHRTATPPEPKSCAHVRQATRKGEVTST